MLQFCDSVILCDSVVPTKMQDNRSVIGQTSSIVRGGSQRKERWG